MNKQEVLIKAEVLTTAEMREYMLERWSVPRAKFESALREALPKEAYFQGKIIKHLKSEFPQGFIWKAAAGAYCQGGIPDICAVIDGTFYGFEVKRPHLGVASKLQEETIRRINEAGGVAAVVSFPRDVNALIVRRETK